MLAHRHIGVDPKAALLHIAVTNPQPNDQCVQGAGISHGLAGRAHDRFGDDLKQWGARPIQIDPRKA